MKHLTLIIISLVLSATVVNASESTETQKVASNSQVAEVVDNRKVLKYGGIRIGGRWNTVMCRYNGYNGKTVYVPQNNFEKNKCPKTIVNEK